MIEDLKNREECYNNWNEIYTRIKSRIHEAEEWIYKLEVRVVEIRPLDRRKKEWREIRTVLRDP